MTIKKYPWPTAEQLKKMQDQTLAPIIPQLTADYLTALRKYQQQIAQAVFTPAYAMTRLATGGTVSKPGPIENAGVRLGTLDGWRLWHVRDGYRLRSVAYNDIWLPGAPMTGDPDKGNAGVYSFKTPEAALNEFLYVSFGPGYDLMNTYVWGQVKLWGRYIEHEHGYRAENAKIVRLIEASPGVDLDAVRALYLDHRCPDNLTPVVAARTGKTVGVTSLAPRAPERRWNPYLGVMVSDDPPPVKIMEPMSPLVQIANVRYNRPINDTIRTQTHFWSGCSLVLEPDQDPTWLPGWLPLPTRDEA